MDLSHATAALASFLLTYLAHSTLVILVIAMALRGWRSAPADVRVLLWKAAIFTPLCTTLAVTLGKAPQLGPTLSLASPQRAPTPLTTHINPVRDLPVDAAAPPASHLRPTASDAPHVAARSDRSETTITTPVVEPRPHSPAPTRHTSMWGILCLAWLMGSILLLAQLAMHALQLHCLRRRSSPVADDSIARLVNDLANRAHIRSSVDVVASEQVSGPLTGGIANPFIVVPPRFLELLSDEELEALFAHELVHIARRDNLWKLMGRVVGCVFFMQPFNRMARKRMEMDTEFVADAQAARLLNHRVGLAACLCRLGEWLVTLPGDHASRQPLATGMASFRSSLGRRVEALLSQDALATTTRLRGIVAAALLGGSLTAMLFAPRAVAVSPLTPPNSPQPQSIAEDRPVKQLTALALVAGLTMPAVADEPKKESRPPVAKTTPDELPSGIARFNGMLVGRLVKKDIEKGKFLVNVDAVPRVWRNSKAENPKSVVGKNVEVDGVSGKWLDALLVVKTGETLEFEARHDGGDHLTFPGELLRKVAPFDPQDYPVLPESFRGFQGAVIGKITKKDPDTFELILEVERVLNAADASRAKDAQSIKGKQMMLAGFWQRKDLYHSLQAGDRIQADMKHIAPRSDHMNIGSVVRKVDGTTERTPDAQASDDGLPEGIRGFRGAFVGRLVEKDVEKGTLEITVDAVPRIWRNSKARKPRSIVGKTIKIDGVSSRFLDVLLTTKKGETLEVAARHDGGNALTFPGELFRKVGPYKAEDYPVLPDGFRGFQGQLSAKILKKDPEMYGFIIQVTEVKRSFDGSQAEAPKSIEGKSAILAGFWRRKEIYGTLKVGDHIELGVRNETTGTDVLSVIEGVRKVGQEER